ncbi:type VI secretion system baseplate subunit TssE [Enterovirga aerilata]|uniref:Type VI secretion system baseplate subunit TssE n=1 Tax=Enterovirga aerilata TaxID=2730920 RepID=A0A849I477_9HYPH|nr:GPW/gp25 family protein [Enterovirga sp. DB1703]NNM74636.1 type VI secretion system baseplate subunit TssE [Enterovirga sp. DB1703]
MAAFRQAFEERDAKQRIDERDEAGERVVAGRRATGRATMSEAALQRAVGEDLENLMNTINLDATIKLDEHEAVRRSILNYGFADVVHRTIDEIGVNDIGEEIQTALRTYEPRLLPGSIQVLRDRSVTADELKIRFIVRADLNCDPLNLPVEFVADLERDTGKITIKRR